MLFFRNTGTSSNPIFAAPNVNPFGLSNNGNFNADPSLVDIDGDGDLDAFIGNRDVGNTLFFRNTGTANNPAFATPVSNPFSLSSNFLCSSFTWADIDGDGDLDAFSGHFYGDVWFFRNTGTTSSPEFAAPTVNLFGLSDVGDVSCPSFIDIDGDGDLDSFVANNTGNILFFTNNVNSLLVSTPGNDILTGTPSNTSDTVTYAFATAAVTVSLLISTQQDTIGAGLDTLTSIENLIGSAFNDNLTGDIRENVLTGGAGNDRLNGRAGVDTMVGGLGNDIYVIDNAGDVVTENLNEGTDKINSSITYTLPANVENLTLTGTAVINGTGNDLNNVITGNSAANQLNGQAGNDTLYGGGGNDTLTGWSGADAMIGGAGNIPI